MELSTHIIRLEYTTTANIYLTVNIDFIRNKDYKLASASILLYDRTTMPAPP